MLQKNDVLAMAETFVADCPQNRVTGEQALRPDLAGLRIWDSPIMAVASADDPLFGHLRHPEVIGGHFRPPKDWMPEARSVLSFFFPFSDAVRQANRADPGWPAPEWIHGRWEGQLTLMAWIVHLKEFIERLGFTTIVPVVSEGFKTGADRNPGPDGSPPLPRYSSNWSERHVAYVCGLGTFGLSAGLITARGIAGRFGSLVTDMPMEPDIRPYAGPAEYCTRCGVCAQRCPVGAISLEKGKIHDICAPFVRKTKEAYAPRYGCGKCQVAVPCERGIPPQGGAGQA